jgi:hypothetical protein
MSDRLTVVFDDPSLYRRIKVRAAEDGVPVKELIEAALVAYLRKGGVERTPFDFEAFTRWQAEMDALDRADPPGPDEPTDLSDVKHHLYGYPRRAERVSEQRVAEEPTPYDSR